MAPRLGSSVSRLAGAVARQMATPLVPDDYLQLVNPLWSSREVRGEIVRVIPETEDSATLVIRPGRGWSMQYHPGQYVGIGVRIDGRFVWRSYSLTSTPESHEGNISITVKEMPEGRLSGHLVHGVGPGTIVRLALPQGEFVLPDPPPAKVLFWTAGSGVTPVMGILRTLARRDTMPDVVHVHVSPDPTHFIFGSELRHLAERHDGLTLVEHYDGGKGDFTLADLCRLVPDWAEREAWVCGPAGMLDAAESHWKDASLDERLHIERFSAKLTGSTEGGMVRFRVSGKEIEVDGATTILDAGERAGVQLPFGCRMGICHTCVVTLKDGKAVDLRDGHEYTEGQKLQTCVCATAGGCTVEA